MSNLIDILGFIGLGLIMLSSVMKDMLTLRIVNILGFTFLALYGYQIESVFLIIYSVILIAIHYYKIFYGKNLEK